jgi:hypothetical protein
MGTIKNVNFGKKKIGPWRLVYATYESAGSRRKRRSLDLRPPAASSSHTPLGESTPRLIKSSKTLQPPLPTKALTQSPSTQHKISHLDIEHLLLAGSPAHPRARQRARTPIQILKGLRYCPEQNNNFSIAFRGSAPARIDI